MMGTNNCFTAYITLLTIVKYCISIPAVMWLHFEGFMIVASHNHVTNLQWFLPVIGKKNTHSNKWIHTYDCGICLMTTAKMSNKIKSIWVPHLMTITIYGSNGGCKVVSHGLPTVRGRDIGIFHQGTGSSREVNILQYTALMALF